MAALGVANFVLASVIVGTVGILLTTLGGVNPFNYTAFVMPALAAGLAARLRSFGWAAAAGLGIGVFQAITTHLLSRGWVPDFFTVGLEALVPFTVIVVVLFVFGRGLPIRGDPLSRGRVWAPEPLMDYRIWGAIITLGLLIAVRGDYNLRLGLIQSMWVTVLLLSMVLITGYLGQVSLTQLGIAGLAAYTLAKLGDGWHVPFPLSPILAIGAATFVGTLVAIPALRLRGMQYAVATFSAAVVLDQFIFRNPFFLGDRAIAHVEPPELGGIELGILRNGSFPSRTFAVGTVIFAALAALLVANVRRSGIGRRFLAVRMNERAVAASGINVARQKILGAALASLVASLAGVMYAYKVIDLSRQGLAADQGLEYVALAFLGGIGSIPGALIGGLIAPSGLLIARLPWDHVTEDVFLAIGVGVLAATRTFPSGIAGLVSSAIHKRALLR